MTFKTHNRFLVVLALVVVNGYLFIRYVNKPVTIYVLIGSALAIVHMFVGYWKIEKDTLSWYYLGRAHKTINIFEIKHINFVQIKKVGTKHFYIGKRANEIREDGYYLRCSDGTIHKIRVDFINSEGVTLGRYLTKKYRIKFNETEEQTLLNDNF